MSLNVLIVDDDMIMRTSLKTMLNWEKHGFVICNEAVNGLNAIELIESSQVDIVITDMSMPIMDGIALISHIELNHPQIKIIALSGYDDFDYVRQSMKNGAIDYILKHRLNPKSLLDVVDIARKSILEGKKELDEQNHNNKKLASAKDILRQEFVIRLIMGEIIDVDKIEHDIHYFDIDMDLKNLVVVAVEMDDYSFMEDNYSDKDRSRLIRTFVDISRNILHEGGKALIEHINNGNFVIIFSFGSSYSSMYVYNKINSDLNRIKTSIKRYLNVTASYGLSKVCFNILDINSFYSEAKSILKDKFYKGKDKIFNDNNIEKNEEDKENYITLDSKDEKEITLFIKLLQKQNVNKCLESIFDRILVKKINYQSVQMIAAELINIASKAAREAGIDISDYFSGKVMPYSILQKYDTVTDIRNWVLNIFDKLIDALMKKSVNLNYSQITQKAIEFIKMSYQNSISLIDAAEFAGVNGSYLSHVFKEDTGKGFVDYLNTVRIEKAKLLIENSKISIKDIVKELGFNSYNYFFKVFKEYIGMTPLEYEESLKEWKNRVI